MYIRNRKVFTIAKIILFSLSRASSTYINNANKKLSDYHKNVNTGLIRVRVTADIQSYDPLSGLRPFVFILRPRQRCEVTTGNNVNDMNSPV